MSSPCNIISVIFYNTTIKHNTTSVNAAGAKIPQKGNVKSCI